MESRLPSDPVIPLHSFDTPTRSRTVLLENQGSTSGLSGDDENLLPDASRRALKRKLLPIDIFMIVISGTIGMGLFESSGEALNIAGPGGGIVAFAIAGIGVICVMQGIAEMLCHWPIENAMVEFVAAFVDRELAIVVGIAYWCSYAINFATMILAAVKLASYWDLALILESTLIIVGAPIILLSINCLRIFWYGRVEVAFGFLKLLFVISTFFIMLGINNKSTIQKRILQMEKFRQHMRIFLKLQILLANIDHVDISEGFQNNAIVAPTRFIAILVAIPIITYAYVGVEIVAATAFEAKSSRSLKFTARYIALITTGSYLFVAIGFYLNVSWTDPLLESLSNILITHERPSLVLPTSTKRSNVIPVIGLLNTHFPTLAGLVNGWLIMVVLSAANTDLFVASRTLSGLVREIHPKLRFFGRLSKLGAISRNSKIPAIAVLVSAIAFFWLPFLHYTGSYNDQKTRQIMIGITTANVLLVWCSQCLALIRFRQWIRKFHHASSLTGDYLRFDPLSSRTGRTSKFAYLYELQPFPGYVGLIFCISTLVFFSASIWDNKGLLISTYPALTSPVLWVVFWLLIKRIRFGTLSDIEWYIELGSWEQFRMQLDRLSAAGVEHQRPFPLNTLDPSPLVSREGGRRNIHNEGNIELIARSTGYEDLNEVLSPIGGGDSRWRSGQNPNPTSGISSSVSRPDQGTENSTLFPRTSVAERLPTSIVPEAGPSSGTLGQQAIQSLNIPKTTLQAAVPPTTTLALTTEQITAAVVVGGIASAGVAVNIGTTIATVRQNERKLAIDEQVERDRVADRKKKEEEEERNKQKNSELHRDPGGAEEVKHNPTAMNENSTTEAAIQTLPSKTNAISPHRKPETKSPYIGSNDSGPSHIRATAVHPKEGQRAQLRKNENIDKLVAQLQHERVKKIETKIENVEKFKREQIESQFPTNESTLHNERLRSLREKQVRILPQDPKDNKVTAEVSIGYSVKGKGKASDSPTEDFETGNFSDDTDIFTGGEGISLRSLVPVNQSHSNLNQADLLPLLQKDDGRSLANPDNLVETENQNPISDIPIDASEDKIEFQEQSTNDEGSGEVAKHDEPKSASKNINNIQGGDVQK